MEPIILTSLPYILSCLLLLLFSILFLWNKVAHSKFNLPPGPWTLPVIGSLHHLARGSLPHHALHNLAQLYGPVMFLRAGEINLVVITSREAAKEVMKTQDANFGNRPPLFAANVFMYGATDIAFSNGPHWRQLRRICSTELFSLKRVKSFSSVRQGKINSMLKCISLNPENSPVNLSEMTCKLTNDIVIAAAFGGKCKNREIFFKILKEVLELLAGFTLSDLFPSLSWLDVHTRRKFSRLQRKLDLVLEDVLQEHIKRPKKGAEDQELEYDLVDVLLNIMENGDLEIPITKDTIKAVISDLFFAGTETTSTLVVWAMTELMKNPEVMAKAQAEIRQAQSEDAKLNTNALRYLKLVIKEASRMHPVASLLAPRTCKETCTILGHTIPSEAKVVINAWSLGRNPEYWDNPEEFKPERFETSDMDFRGQHFEFVPFGAGRRICPGLEFGIAMAEEILASLLLHFDWKLPEGMNPEDVDMTELFGVVAVKKVPLCLIPTMSVNPFKA